MEPQIACQELIKIYRTRRVRYRALAGISLDVAPGEFVAVVGTSGSGKSTLLNLLAGLEPPTSGKVFIGNRALHRMHPDELAEFRLRHTGFIFQNFNLFADLSALENTAFPLMLRGMGKDRRERRAAQMLESLGLEKHMHHGPAELSGGQQQRVSIARALITEPKILFADEPTGNLDTATADETMQILEQAVREQGTTLLMVTHDPCKAARADRIIHIRDGRIEAIEPGRLAQASQETCI